MPHSTEIACSKRPIFVSLRCLRCPERSLPCRRCLFLPVHDVKVTPTVPIIVWTLDPGLGGCISGAICVCVCGSPLVQAVVVLMTNCTIAIKYRLIIQKVVICRRKPPCYKCQNFCCSLSQRQSGRSHVIRPGTIAAATSVTLYNSPSIMTIIHHKFMYIIYRST